MVKTNSILFHVSKQRLIYEIGFASHRRYCEPNSIAHYWNAKGFFIDGTVKWTPDAVKQALISLDKVNLLGKKNKKGVNNRTGTRMKLTSIILKPLHR